MAQTGYLDSSGHAFYQDSSLPAPSWYTPDAGSAKSTQQGPNIMPTIAPGGTVPSYNIPAPQQAPPKPLQPLQPQVVDNSALIQQMFAQQKAESLAQLKQAIANSQAQYQDTIASTPGTYDKLRNTVQANYNNGVGAYQNAIDQAPGQYQPLRDQASAAGYKNLASLREMLANQGQQGGVNRTDTTAVNSATENNINALNLQQQNKINTAQTSIDALNKDRALKLADLATQQQQVIDQANTAINRLQASGSLQEAQMVAHNAGAALQALISESNRVQQAGYQQSQDAIKNAMNEARLTGTYQGAPTLAATNAADNRALSLAQLMGSYNGEPTLAAQNATDNRALSLAQLLGVYDGQPTLAAQNAAADQVYKNAALAASQARASAPKAPSAAEQRNNAVGDAYDRISELYNNGVSSADIMNEIRNNEGTFRRNGVNPNDLYDYLINLRAGTSATRYQAGGHEPQ